MTKAARKAFTSAYVLFYCIAQSRGLCWFPEDPEDDFDKRMQLWYGEYSGVMYRHNLDFPFISALRLNPKGAYWYDRCGKKIIQDRKRES